MKFAKGVWRRSQWTLVLHLEECYLLRKCILYDEQGLIIKKERKWIPEFVNRTEVWRTKVKLSRGFYWCRSGVRFVKEIGWNVVKKDFRELRIEGWWKKCGLILRDSVLSSTIVSRIKIQRTEESWSIKNFYTLA